MIFLEYIHSLIDSSVSSHLPNTHYLLKQKILLLWTFHSTGGRWEIETIIKSINRIIFDSNSALRKKDRVMWWRAFMGSDVRLVGKDYLRNDIEWQWKELANLGELRSWKRKLQRAKTIWWEWCWYHLRNRKVLDVILESEENGGAVREIRRWGRIHRRCCITVRHGEMPAVYLRAMGSFKKENEMI